jgi:hypothetical protein
VTSSRAEDLPEPPGDDPVLVRNETDSNAVLYVTLIFPKSATSLRIEKPQPAGCAAH